MPHSTITLASSSPTRALILNKLHLPFAQIAPNIDETAHANESPRNLVQRLGKEKAYAVANTGQQGIIIAGDQVLLHRDRVIGKPHTKACAIQQLTLCSGQTVTSLASLSVLHTQSQTFTCDIATCTIRYKKLSAALIEKYIDCDTPFQCAGSIAFEKKGFILIESLESNDPYSIYGMPLLTLTSRLQDLGIDTMEMLTM